MIWKQSTQWKENVFTWLLYSHFQVLFQRKFWCQTQQHFCNIKKWCHMTAVMSKGRTCHRSKSGISSLANDVKNIKFGHDIRIFHYGQRQHQEFQDWSKTTLGFSSFANDIRNFQIDLWQHHEFPVWPMTSVPSSLANDNIRNYQFSQFQNQDFKSQFLSLLKWKACDFVNSCLHLKTFSSPKCRCRKCWGHHKCMQITFLYWL